jgi:methyltransferase (TIGR00027 family)
MDFKKDALPDALNTSGYQATEKTFFIWEGVSMYLSEPAVRDTLRSISGYSASGSTLVMDFAEAAMIELLQKNPHLSQHNYTTHWGEPWIFGLPDMDEQTFFRECGLELRNILPFFSQEASRLYLTCSDGSSFGTVRGGPPEEDRFSTMVRTMWMFFTRKSHWYALAKLDVLRQL